MSLIPAERGVSKTWKKHAAAAAWPASVRGTCSLHLLGDKGLWFRGWDPETLTCSWIDGLPFYYLGGIFFSVMGRGTSGSSVEAKVVMVASLVLELVMIPGSKKGYQACCCPLAHAA